MLAVGAGQTDAAIATYDAKYTLMSMSVICLNGCENYPNHEVRVYADLRLDRSTRDKLLIDDAGAPDALTIEIRYGSTLDKSLFKHTLKRRANGQYFFDVFEKLSPLPIETPRTVSWDGNSGGFYTWPATYSIEQQTFVSFEIAPVPLPAGAALLPVGLATLTMIRNRRRA